MRSLAVLLLALAACRAAPLAPEVARAEDFAAFERFVRDSYAGFEGLASDWDAVVAELAPRARAASERATFVHVLEDALAQLYDGHSMLGTNVADSWRPVPANAWVERRDGRWLVTCVQRGSDAERAGVRPGDELLAVDGEALEARSAARRPRHLVRPEPRAEAWAVASAVAGRHDSRGEFRVRRAGEELVLVPRSGERAGAEVEWRWLADGVGYVRIASFASERIVAQVDQVLAELRPARALVIDVRSNAGGDTAVARPILGRFVRERVQYAWMARREGAGLGPRWPEFIEPRGPWTYEVPVAVLVDRFSVSMAEGFAMALQGLGRAKLVGTPMGQLGAAVTRLRLPHSRIPVQLSTEPVYTLDGRPRDEVVPDVVVDPLAQVEGDPWLVAALEVLAPVR